MMQSRIYLRRPRSKTTTSIGAEQRRIRWYAGKALANIRPRPRVCMQKTNPVAQPILAQKRAMGVR